MNFLDITLDLKNQTYKPYIKPGNTILYVNKDSNHPPSILKNIPMSINKRLCEISSSKTEFDATMQPYQEALKNSGYDFKLHYNEISTNHKKKNRQRNITWYNPPYSMNVKTKIGKKFIQIVKKCFPHDHPLTKIFNTQTLKLSYSCMPNLKSKIDNHNNNTLKSATPIPKETEKTCNCRVKNNCPLDNKCLTKNIVYQAKVTRLDNLENETYVGLCETEFKARYNNDKSSFKLENKKHQTELSKFVWKLKESKIDYEIRWKVLKTCRPYSNVSKRCNVCLHEKFLIICKPELCTLNKRQELSSTCRHSKSYLLTHVKI